MLIQTLTRLDVFGRLCKMKKTHEQNRLKICLLCFKKVKEPKLIHNTLTKTIKQCFISEYDEDSEIYPKVLCGSCYIGVYRCQKGEQYKKIDVHQYQVRKHTRDSTKHVDCEICCLAQQTLPKRDKVPKKKKGAPFMKVCRKCFSQIHRGKVHKCCKTTKINNLTMMAGESKDQMVSKAIREKVSNDQPVASFSNLRGKPTAVKVVNAEEKGNKEPISHEEMIEWKKDLDLSTRKVRSKLALICLLF